jgi:hypothetical protein
LKAAAESLTFFIVLRGIIDEHIDKSACAFRRPQMAWGMRHAGARWMVEVLQQSGFRVMLSKLHYTPFEQDATE